jgi:hypothetical protein
VNVISNNIGRDRNNREKIGQDYSKLRLHKINGNWQFNEVHDLIVPTCESPLALVTKEDKCSPIPEVNSAITSCEVVNTQNFRNRKFSGRYMNYRLVQDEENNFEIKLLYLDTVHDTSQPDRMA